MFLLSPLISPHFTVQLVHLQPALAPLVALPAGFSLRSFLPGDRQTWVSLQSLADPGRDVTEETFVEEFGRHQRSLISRQFYALTHEGKPVGTSTAWFAGKTSGLVKGLAVSLAHSSCGLEEALLSEAMRRFVEFRYEKAHATLNAHRVDLVHLFLNFGFQPEIHSVRDEAIWEEIQGAAGELTREPLFLRIASWFQHLIKRK